MAAAIGNQYAAKSRVWTQAINNVLERRHPEGRMAALEALAEKLIQGVETGDLAAIKEFGDRMEGKATQGVELTGADGGPVLQSIDWNIVNTKP